MILDFNEIRPRILNAMIIESIVFIIILTIAIKLYYRYKNNPKNNAQTRILSMMFFCWSAATVFSLFGKALQYTYTYEINKTELGIISNWSMSLMIIIIGIYYQAEFSWYLFPPEKKDRRRSIRFIYLGSAVLFSSIPRYWNGTEVKLIYMGKFLIVFLFMLNNTVYFVRSVNNVKTFAKNDFLLKRIKALNFMHFALVSSFALLLFSSLYGATTGIYYSWPYFSASTCLALTALFALIGTKSMPKATRRLYEENKKKKATNLDDSTSK